MSSARHILTLSCVNRPGIVAKVSTALFDRGFNILDAQQFDDVETGDFFMRVMFNAATPQASVEGLREKFMAIAAGLAITLRLMFEMAPEERGEDISYRPT
jgi:formyltetrahydrofolate deformylase